MAKVTSKYQVTVPRAIAQRYRIRSGDEIEWVAADGVIHVAPSTGQITAEDRDSKLRLFDQATERHRRRPSGSNTKRRAVEIGRERISASVAALVDTNILVYHSRFSIYSAERLPTLFPDTTPPTDTQSASRTVSCRRGRASRRAPAAECRCPSGRPRA
jgi:bifunctional DNA-binding transcriptional regulator/antitoxin component of YhaV-PrlF toxin-antitoxin module